MNPEPVILYDINGKKLYYEFSVENNTEMVGRMKVSANKVLGNSVKTFEIGPRSWNADAIMQKSIEVANDKYPDGKVKFTKMVVYGYPHIGAMTLVLDKTTGEKHRIFVDAYTLEIIPDKAPTETEEGIWSMYEQKLISKDKIDKNIKRWKKSDEFAEFVDVEATNMGIDIHKPLSEKNLKRLSDSSVNTMTSEVTLDVPLHGQINGNACALATAQMIAEYYGKLHSQLYISTKMNDCGIIDGCSNTEQLMYYKDPNGLDKTLADDDYSPEFSEAEYEINWGRPLKSGIAGHARVARGYRYDWIGASLYINDPSPIGNGDTRWEGWDDVVHTNYIYV